MKKSSYTDPRIVLFSNYIKYGELARMTNIGFEDADGNRLNIYIDLTKIFRSLLKFDVMPENEMVSTVINMSAHYISFYKKMGVEANVTFVYSDNSANHNCRIISNYSHELDLELYTVSMKYKGAIEKIKALCQYLPRTFFCQRNCETVATIYALILDHKNKGDLSPSLVITNDLYAWQLVCHDNLPYVTIFQRDGIVITKKNVLSNIVHRYKLQSNPFDGIHPGLLSLYWVLTSFKSRDLGIMFNSPTAMRVICNAISRRVILNNHNVSIDMLLPDIAMMKNMAGHRLDKRYQLIDVVNQYYMYKDIVCLHTFDDVYIFLHDPLAVQGLMDLFVDNPIDLDRLS